MSNKTTLQSSNHIRHFLRCLTQSIDLLIVSITLPVFSSNLKSEFKFIVICSTLSLEMLTFFILSFLLLFRRILKSFRIFFLLRRFHMMEAWNSHMFCFLCFLYMSDFYVSLSYAFCRSLPTLPKLAVSAATEIRST